MTKIKSYFLNLYATDLVVVGFYIILTLINFIFYARVPEWYILNAINIFIIVFVFYLAKKDSESSSKIIHSAHNWYLLVLIFITFKELYLMISPIHGRDYDNILIQIDRFIFGTDPTHFLYQFAHPVLTELLQWTYFSFYFLPIILGVKLILDKKLPAFYFVAFSIVYGFFLSYLGYLTLPAIGPRFTLHDFYAMNIELPGLFATNWMRELINNGESVTSVMPEAAKHVQRDVFPSGHTQMTLITMFLSIKFRSVRFFILPVGALLVFSTVYLRYHYVVDIVAGTIFFIFTMWSGYKLYNWWGKITNGHTINYSDFR